MPRTGVFSNLSLTKEELLLTFFLLTESRFFLNRALRLCSEVGLGKLFIGLQFFSALVASDRFLRFTRKLCLRGFRFSHGTVLLISLKLRFS